MDSPSAEIRDSCSLRLPVDSYAVPGAESHVESYDFELRIPPSEGRSSAPNEALLAAAFAILLARLTGQSPIGIRASRWTANGRRKRAHTIHVTTRGATRGDVLDLIRAQLGRFEVGAESVAISARNDPLPSGSGSPSMGLAGSTAGFAWLEEAGPGVETVNGVDAVKRGLSEHEGADLCLVAKGGGARLSAAFVYDSGLFKRTTIQRFAGHLGVVLAGFVSGQDLPIAEVPLLTPTERQWLEAMCDGRPCILPGDLVHEQIEQHAAAMPDAIAVRYRDQYLTYADLNTRANRLSRYLGANGIGSESHVVVCLEPGLRVPVALLAILKAGAVYVPLDPAYPVARIRVIVEDVGPSLVITSRHLRDGLSLGDVSIFTIDDEADLEQFSGENVSLTIEPDQAATIFYTSGTTGKPKGVVATCANLASYVALPRERYQVSRRDIVPAIARFSFSISLFELLVPLTAGGTLVVLDRDHVLNPAHLADTLKGVTLFHAGPSLLRGLIAHIERHYTDFSVFSGVRHASSGGDMVPPDVLEGLKRVFPSAEVFVIYGCSEISCMGCTYPVPRDRTVDKTYVGRPFDNTKVRVVDAAFNLLPVGVVGEICFSGSGVVRGYLDVPDLTGEKFIRLGGGRRFYRTGDMGRISEEGWLEILGRSDFQVKVRGMRIELGEVEHHLRRAPGVREGVVRAWPSADGEMVLIAYVVLDPDYTAHAESTERTRATATRRHMTAHLPDYMVPAIYVELDHLPLNHNMKVDRRALLDPRADLAQGFPRSATRQPETPTERILAVIWKRLLGVDTVGLDDNFFELGGFSLLAAGLILEVEVALGVTLDGMDVLRESLEVLGRICDERLGKRVDPPALVPVSRVPAEAVEFFHFGSARDLRGVLHRPFSTNGAAASPPEAVLICGPVGQEKVRAHFVLNRLAAHLVGGGIPVLEFDYHGCGDSLGDSRDSSCTSLQENIRDAFGELRKRFPGARITAIGARLGATLLWDMADHLDVSRLVLWDPICHGAAHLLDLVTMHRHYLAALDRPWFRLWSTGTPRKGGAAKTANGTELLGSTYSDRALAELCRLSMAPRAAATVPIRWLATSPAAPDRERATSIVGTGVDARFEVLDVDCAWQDVARLEDILPDLGIARGLARMVMGSP